jgi:hypothetical protein
MTPFSSVTLSRDIFFLKNYPIPQNLKAMYFEDKKTIKGTEKAQNAQIFLKFSESSM